MDYQTIKAWRLPAVECTYDERDTMLYALAVGYGADPLDREQLRYVYEDGLVAAPSMPLVLGHPGFWMDDPAAGIDWLRVVLAEQSLQLHAPIPPSGTVIGRTHVSAVVDKGPGRGVLVHQTRTVTDAATGTLLATTRQVNFCRGDGGLEHSDPAPPPPPPAPDREPDATCDLPTTAHAALLYRLLGDRNPLHADPDVARRAGFERPILHGLCTFGVAVHALLRLTCDSRPDGLGSISARFSAPTFPGETIRTEIWHEDGCHVFRATAVERDVVVLTSGEARPRTTAAASP